MMFEVETEAPREWLIECDWSWKFILFISNEFRAWGNFELTTNFFFIFPDQVNRDIEHSEASRGPSRARLWAIRERTFNMGVPSTNQLTFKLGLIAFAALVIISVVDGAENEQHLFHKEYERLQKQVKPVNYNWQDQIANNQQQNHRRIPNYQHPQFNANFPSRSTYGVQQQEQRQEQHLHHPQPRILKIENTKYSVWSQNMTYMSSTDYNALGMGQLYNLTNKAIDFFVDKDEPIPPGERVN